MKIVGIDPGGTTGLAVVSYNKRRNKYRLECYDQINGYELVYKNVPAQDYVKRLLSHQPNLVVIEDFIGGGYRSTDSNDTTKLVGFFVGSAIANGIPAVLQVPKRRRPFVQLAKASIDKRFKHSADAYAHVLYYLHKEFKCVERVDADTGC